ncbi:hypothetical protein ACFVW1_40305 [Streptomyces olivochromogenes]|uniref:hypothetical protein n=1 Tax=Streptomyces olivochromogenes TaxID=1963 RepID=UPI0036DD8FD7
MAALMLRRIATVLSCWAVAAGVVMAPTVTEAAARGCYRDAYPPGGGTNIGGSPNRYKWDGSPYMGARYDSCRGYVDVIYGGYRATHYNVRWVAPGGPWEQGELSAAKGLWSWPARHGDYNLTIQACNRGALQRSSCTNWSPQLYLNTR